MQNSMGNVRRSYRNESQILKNNRNEDVGDENLAWLWDSEFSMESYSVQRESFRHQR